MIDNFQQIREMLIWNDADKFYFIQILQRRKENPEIGSNSVVIKNYYIHSLVRFNELEEEIKELCREFNARAMIRLNRRSYEQIHLKTIEKLVNQLGNKDYKSAKNAYSSVCGTYHSEESKTWIVDIDERIEVERLEKLVELINRLQPVGSKVLAVIPSKNGCHLITKPFNVEEYRKMMTMLDGPVFDIHKDNPTNLFIP